MRIGKLCWLCCLAIGWTLPAGAADAAKACALLTPAEIESAIGLKVSDFNPGAAPGSLANPGTGDLCTGIAPAATKRGGRRRELRRSRRWARRSR